MDKLKTRNAQEYRAPEIEDGPKIWKLVKECGTLDLNSAYCYLVLCKHFSDTCLVAEEEEGRLAGFVTGYFPPGASDVLFIWQIGVAPHMRGKGIARNLLLNLLNRDSVRNATFLETTISPFNAPSRALFVSLSRRLKTKIVEKPLFSEALFPDGVHPPEHLYRIGPINPITTHP